MAKYKKNQKPTVSHETVQEAEAVAKSIQRPGQTKEQTKLIAQGIQKGIEQYKKQQKSKARELDKKLKKVRTAAENGAEAEQEIVDSPEPNAPVQWLPWALLGLSWAGFAAYVLMGA